MSGNWHLFREVGALVGHPEPADFANFMTAPPCEHYGQWQLDEDEVCPAPCGQRHEWCVACGRPMKPPCSIVASTDPLSSTTDKDPIDD